MTDNWDFYFLQVDNKPASMYVDLGIRDVAPMSSLPYMAYIRLHMKSPRSDGLSSQEEFSALIEIEDSIKAQLVTDGTEYVGRCTTNSCRDFFFYIADSNDWERRATNFMNSFQGYTHVSGIQEDSAWSTYLSYLHPSDAALQTIENRRVCEALQQNGDKLVEARELDHWSYFPSVDSRDTFIAEAVKLGYKVRMLTTTDDTYNQYCIQLFRFDLPTFNTIDDITTPLFELSAKHGGEYDGWESIVIS